jgi:hypothetical protein
MMFILSILALIGAVRFRKRAPASIGQVNDSRTGAAP